MQRQPYKHVVLDTVLKRKDIYRQRLTLKEMQKCQLAKLQEMVNADRLTRKTYEATKQYMYETVEYRAPLRDQPLLYRIWVHLKRFFVGKNK